ncbi:CHASE2 domain-containing protein [Pseudahrensia aquimaris]|uniref:CHASE2 domain-containing protein n=1 Tax=Pseudahrensia aquimaris TaxID=744461 RepID=A0ABW3FDV8_9HYPH
MKALIAKFGLGRLAGLAVLGMMLAMRVWDPTPLQSFRNQAFDLYQRLQPREYQRQPVAIIDIDEASIRQHGQWPWPRTKLAELVNKVGAMGVAAIGFDIVFAEPDRLSPQLFADDNPTVSPKVRDALKSLPSNDAIFAAAISKAAVVVGQTSVRSGADVTLERPQMKDVPHAFLGPDPTKFMKKYPSIVQNLPELEAAAKGYGVFTIEPDSDGVFRRFPLVMMVQDKVRLFLSAEVLRVATGGDAFAVRSNAAGIDGIVVARQLIETNPYGAVWPHFSESRQERFVSAGDILDGKVPPERLRGHLTLVGTSAIGLEDYRATPMAQIMAGVEIHAQIIENILSKSMLVRPNYAIGAELATIALVGLLAIVLIPYLGAFWSFVLGGFLVGGYFAGSFLAFSQFRMLIDPTFPFLSTTAVFIVLSGANYFQEERRRRQIKQAFGQYVSPDLVNKLADKPGGLALGGETRELTVLFSDVRGFTAISEGFKHNPQGLTLLMNRFLNVLSQPILQHDGTIDKFMGDAVMAFWNAPLDHTQHAYSASLAAIEMREEVAALNAKEEESHRIRKRDDPDYAGQFFRINVGIGINTGDCVVGNMGSDNRFDYTALGDTVNLASRLEGQSKPYGIGIVIGSNTADLVADRLALLEIDLIRVKGKEDAERIYGLFGRDNLLASDGFQEMQRLNKSMLGSYRKQDWETAFAALELMRELDDDLGLGLDDYLLIYETRIAEYEANPPGRSWDGVFDALTK